MGWRLALWPGRSRSSCSIVTVQLETVGTVGDFLYLPEVLLLVMLVFSGLAGPVWTTSSRARWARR